MQCVVLAGGLATRMWPRTEDTPKWLLPVAGRPFAHWQLEWLAGHGVDRVVACIGYLGSQIVSAIGDGGEFGVSIEYSEDGPELRGTGGALCHALDRGLLDDRFLVVYGDSYLPVDVAAVWAAFLADHEHRPALMTVFHNEGAFDASNAAYVDGQVLRYTKAAADGSDSPLPALDYIDYGLSAMSRSVLDGLPRDEAVDLAMLFESLAEGSRLAGFEVTERFYEIGSPAGLADLEALLSSHD